jgi:predicted  nucleic acid-binding Zn-ribbon protein
MNATLNHLIQLQELVLQYENADHTSALSRRIDHLRAQLPQDVLRRFDHVADHRRIGVASLLPSGACGICHMKLPPADVQRIRTSTHMLPVCPLCGGFLYAANAAVQPVGQKSEVAI